MIRQQGKLFSSFQSNQPGSVIILFCVLVALCLYACHLTSDLYGDEVGHTYRVIKSLDFWSVLKRDAIIHPPLYFILAKASYEAIERDWAIRLPSLLAALGTVLLAPLAARRFLGPGYCFPAVLVAVTSPFLLEFAAEGRPYALSIFLSVALIWAFLTFVENENWANAVMLSVVALAGALTHYFFLLQLPAVGIYYLAAKRRLTRHSIGTVAILLVVLLPLAVYLASIPKGQYAGYVQDHWATTYFSPMNFLARLMVALNFGFSTFSLPNLDPGRNVSLEMLKANWITLPLSLLAIVGVGYGLLRRVFWGLGSGVSTNREKYFWFFVLSFAVPLSIGLAAGLSGRTLLREKHLAAIWAPWFFLVLISFGYLVNAHGRPGTKKDQNPPRPPFIKGGGKFGYVVVCSYACVVLISLWHFVFLPNEYSRRMDWTGLNGVLSAEAGASDVILFYSGAEEHLSLGKLQIDKLEAGRMSVLRNKPYGETVSDFAGALNAATKGRIFLVNHEEQRLLVDPNMETIKTLRALRNMQEMRFGRNLVLCVFNPPTTK